MSHVTNVMLHVGTLEEVTLDQINASASEQEGQVLHSISDEHVGCYWGGSKMPEAEIYAAAFNYLRLDEFMAHLAALPWTDPGEVQLLIKDQNEERFTVYQLVAREWVALYLAPRVLSG